MAVDYGTKAPPPKYSWESSAKPSGDNSKANDAEQKERERQAKAVATLLQKIDRARTPVVTGVALATLWEQKEMTRTAVPSQGGPIRSIRRTKAGC
uniref:hypothetical protein n=1 Tax=Klebsiella pneumoniae TaxID=573 RepID=UPI0022BA329F|nr:hypothetical protein [Klebsiella pneumoniae]